MQTQQGCYRYPLDLNGSGLASFTKMFLVEKTCSIFFLWGWETPFFFLHVFSNEDMPTQVTAAQGLTPIGNTALVKIVLQFL